MKKFKLCFLLFVLLFPICSYAKTIDLYLFYGDGCPHCAKEKEYLSQLQKQYQIDVHLYEVWYQKENQELLKQVKKTLGADSNYVPFTVIGNQYMVGFNDNTKLTIKKNIQKCLKEDCKNIVQEIVKGKEISETPSDNNQKEESIKTIPLLGKVDVKKVSLPIISAIIGLVDGFNPCAMWVLLFLISMLIGSNNRKKMWILGLTFLFTSAFIYLLLMSVWLNIAIQINTIMWLRTCIAIVAIIGALINFKKYYDQTKHDVGCKIVDSSKRKKIIRKIKKFTLHKNILFGMVGMSALAISVNVIELACSAGLPLLFTQILSFNELSRFQYILYMIIYIFFFLLDDIIIFSIAMITLKIIGISNKYSKYAHIIGGIIMLFIGILMLVKPEWLMLNF